MLVLKLLFFASVLEDQEDNDIGQARQLFICDNSSSLHQKIAVHNRIDKLKSFGQSRKEAYHCCPDFELHLSDIGVLSVQLELPEALLGSFPLGGAVPPLCFLLL